MTIGKRSVDTSGFGCWVIGILAEAGDCSMIWRDAGESQLKYSFQTPPQEPTHVGETKT